MKQTLEIILKPEIEKLFDQFCSIFGIRIIFYSVAGKILKTGLNRGDSQFCRLIQQQLCGIDKCLAMDEEKRQECAIAGETVSYRCHAGLNEAVAPIYVDNQLIGFAMIGQFRTIRTTPHDLTRAWHKKYHNVELEQAFHKLPYFEPEKVRDIIGFFSVIIDYIVTKEIVALRGNLVISRIISHIEKNIHRSVSVEEAAQTVGKSVSTITHLFRKVTGKSFKQTLINRKLDVAERYFRQAPNLSISEVAAKVGYDDPFYFSRLYRKYRGISPSEYLALDKP